MSRSYWLRVIAAVGLALTVSGNVVHAEQHKAYPQGRAANEQSATVQAPPPAKEQEPPRANPQTDTEKRAEQRDKDNLTVQRQIADSARKQTDYTWYQNLFTGIEAFLLAVTIFFTGWAAWAASEGTKRAREAIAQSERHARIALRPYITAEAEGINITPSSATSIDGPIEVIFRGKFTNSGQMPAEHIRIRTDIRVLDWPPKPEQLAVVGELEGLTTQGIGRESEHTYRFYKFVIVDGQKLKIGSQRIVLTGRLDYDDAWGQSHPSEFVGSVVGIADLIIAWEISQAAQLTGKPVNVPIPNVQFEWYRPRTAKDKMTN